MARRAGRRPAPRPGARRVGLLVAAMAAATTLAAAAPLLARAAVVEPSAVASEVVSARPSPDATVAATPDVSPTPNPFAGEPWWVPAGLRGQALSAVAVSGADIEVHTTAGGDLLSSDGGLTFAAVPRDPGAVAGPVASADVRSGNDEWLIRGGHVLHALSGGTPVLDPGSPDLGAGAHLLAAPVAARGTVLAVSDAGLVWRRAGDGTWGRALLLLPRTLVGTPQITDLAAFSASPPGSSVVTVYLATDGYSVLATSDGGYSWVRDGPGLPDRVSALAAAPAQSAIFAATDDGLWVHHLRTPPSIPQYAAPDLRVRQMGIAAITVATCAAATAGLWLALRRRPRWAR